MRESIAKSARTVIVDGTPITFSLEEYATIRFNAGEAVRKGFEPPIIVPVRIVKKCDDVDEANHIFVKWVMYRCKREKPESVTPKAREVFAILDAVQILTMREFLKKGGKIGADASRYTRETERRAKELLKVG